MTVPSVLVKHAVLPEATKQLVKCVFAVQSAQVFDWRTAQKLEAVISDGDPHGTEREARTLLEPHPETGE